MIQLNAQPTLGVAFEDTDEDEEPVDSGDIGRAVVTGTDWTTETILSQLRRGNIQLNPSFQRRDAWDVTRKSRFIESLLLGLPIPQLVLAEDKKRRGAFIVLDGKQRLLALRQFAVDSSVGDPSTDASFNRLELKRLEVRPDCEGKSLSDFESDDAFAEDLNAFLNQPIRTVVVRSWPDETFLNLVFLRLNTGSVQLSPQELRQALHPGPFTQFLDDFSAESPSIRRALRSDTPDFRMRDVEIMLRFCAFTTGLEEYRGNLKKFLDDATERLNLEWLSQEQEVRNVAESCERAVDGAFSIFGENAFYRWDQTRYEHRFNRAVFDVMTYYFKDERVVTAAALLPGEVESAFRTLCDSNREFRQSIQSTTKTILATYTRLEAWGTALQAVLGLPLAVPSLNENRIELPSAGG